MSNVGLRLLVIVPMFWCTHSKSERNLTAENVLKKSLCSLSAVFPNKYFNSAVLTYRYRYRLGIIQVWPNQTGSSIVLMINGCFNLNSLKYVNFGVLFKYSVYQVDCTHCSVIDHNPCRSCAAVCSNAVFSLVNRADWVFIDIDWWMSTFHIYKYICWECKFSFWLSLKLYSRRDWEIVMTLCLESGLQLVVLCRGICICL